MESIAFVSLLLLAAVDVPPAGGAATPVDTSDALSPATTARLLDEQVRNVDALRARGVRLSTPDAPRVTGMQWPLAPQPGVGIDWHSIGAYVDHDPAFPDQVRDYACNAVTYDDASGYNHRGTDFVLWPFAWTIMDAQAITVAAAAPGTIIAKADGNFDRECTFEHDTPNYVFVQHGDGTVAWYLHLKNGSVTTKPIGASVIAGEALGKIGSSGVSGAPHLHLELRASAAGDAAVIDPFNGACNAAPTAWAAQRPYYDSALNRLATHDAPPEFPICPATIEVPHFRDAFSPGEDVYIANYWRDQRHGQVSQHRVLRPDDSVYDSWTFDLAMASGSPAHQTTSYWYWIITLPPDAPSGVWHAETTYLGITTAHAFTVGDALFSNGFE